MAIQHRAWRWRARRKHLGTDPAARKHGGGNLWTPMSFDEEKNLLYLPGGNAAPDIYDESRPGANLYTNSFIVRDRQFEYLVSDPANKGHRRFFRGDHIDLRWFQLGGRADFLSGGFAFRPVGQKTSPPTFIHHLLHRLSRFCAHEKRSSHRDLACLLWIV